VLGAMWEKEAAWAFIFERRWVMALGVTSVFWVFRVSGLFDRLRLEGERYKANPITKRHWKNKTTQL